MQIGRWTKRILIAAALIVLGAGVRPWVASQLPEISLLASKQNGDQFIGVWRNNRNARDIFQVTRNDRDTYLVDSGGRKYGAVYREGQLISYGSMGSLSLTYLVQNDTTLLGGEVFTRVPSSLARAGSPMRTGGDDFLGDWGPDRNSQGIRIGRNGDALWVQYIGSGYLMPMISATYRDGQLFSRAEHGFPPLTRLYVEDALLVEGQLLLRINMQ